MRYSYELFCQRKNFLIKNYFIIYPEATYSDFCEFLLQRNVVPPPEDVFNRSKPEKEVAVEESTITEESAAVEENATEEVKKPKRRRRSVKKNSSDVSQ